MAGNWVISWSPKNAIVYVRNPAFIDSEQRSSDQFRLGVSVGGNIDATRGREETYYRIIITAKKWTKHHTEKTYAEC